MSLAIGEAPTPSGFESLPGVTPPSSREPQPGFLSDTIVAMGLVDQAHAEAAVAESRVRGIPPERLLIDQGHLSDEDLARARAERAGLDYVDLETFERDHSADALIGRDAALRHHALPISVQGRALVVALSDPFDAPAIASGAAIDARTSELPELDDAPPEPPQLQPIAGGGGRRATDGPQNRRATDAPRNGLPDSLTERIVEKVDATVDEVVRSEILRALDDATAEIEELSAKLEQAEQRAQALENERDELRTALGSDPGSS
jgi:hypothetical protein